MHEPWWEINKIQKILSDATSDGYSQRVLAGLLWALLLIFVIRIQFEASLRTLWGDNSIPFSKSDLLLLANQFPTQILIELFLPGLTALAIGLFWDSASSSIVSNIVAKFRIKGLLIALTLLISGGVFTAISNVPLIWLIISVLFSMSAVSSLSTSHVSLPAVTNLVRSLFAFGINSIFSLIFLNQAISTDQGVKTSIKKSACTIPKLARVELKDRFLSGWILFKSGSHFVIRSKDHLGVYESEVYRHEDIISILFFDRFPLEWEKKNAFPSCFIDTPAISSSQSGK